jgi:hypothetical protein
VLVVRPGPAATPPPDRHAASLIQRKSVMRVTSFLSVAAALISGNSQRAPS